jgi:hypothetical protein
VTAQVTLEDIMISEISQTQKDKHHMMSLLCGIQKSETRANRTMVPGAGGEGNGGM